MDKRRKQNDLARQTELRDQFRRDILAHKLSIRDAVKAMRRLSRLTQPEFARHRGVSLPTLRQIEAGTGNPSVETLNKICSIFGLQVGFIPEIEDRDVSPAGQGYDTLPAADRREVLKRYSGLEISAKDAMDALGLGCVEDLHEATIAAGLKLPRIRKKSARRLAASAAQMLKGGSAQDS